MTNQEQDAVAADQTADSSGNVGLIIAGIVILLFALGFGWNLYGTALQPALAATAAAPAAGAAPANEFSDTAQKPAPLSSDIALTPTPSETPAAGDAARVATEDGVVHFYFAPGKVDLPPGASEALAEIVKGVAVGKTVVVSGYHDATGDAAQNEELAKQRALAVRDALTALGIDASKIDLEKPQTAAAANGSSDAAERRVDVSLKD